ncbi:hypothetical protein P3X46_013259 [Hevea brasiliensis]|uniref:Pentacotripeptide-repeat region of PRORP domain-containing protein n=1 Tax=Hevea brasiliensis TaxID=3981 RepID=A0ABQ9M6V2_HEVBR|nr:pentatricopeptide repeat-containing protein At1g10910, chloroplastic isoform X2 [Hevea brasiliensis]KAJ9174636.1 hypothetical protein P3X46_013259 [Hevea brasiliensis]
MELSAIGTGFNYALTCPAQSYFPLIPSASAPTTTTRRKNSQRTSAVTATPLLKEPRNESQPPPPSGQRRHSKSYLARQAAILEVQQSSDLDSALQRLEGTLKVQDLNVILRNFGKQSRWNDLSQLFDWMQQNDKISVASFSSCIKFMGKSLNPMRALEIYSNIPDEAIKSCIKVKHGYSKALDLVQELKYNGLQMDSVMYGTLLAVCASNNQCEEAESYFNQMKDEGHSPNIFHYSSLLNAYSAVGNYRKAEELVQDMKSLGLVPNKVIRTTLLKVYVRGGLFEKSRELLLELEALGYAEDEMPYCLLMDGLAKAGNINEARSIFDEMKEKGVKSDGYSHSIMISAYCRGGFFEEAKQLAKDFEAQYDKYDLVMLNTLLCAYCRADDMESVMQTMMKMDELRISPSYTTFHILIKYFCKQKLYLLAYRTMEDMHRKGHQPQEELCSSLIFYLGKTKAHPEAFSVYTMLKYGKRTMCKALHEKILHILLSGQLLKDAYVVVKDNTELISQAAIKKFANAFMKLGNINMINDVMKVIHGSGYKIDQELFQMAISRYIENPEKKDLLLQLLKWMPGQGYAVDSSTRNLILKNSHLFGCQLIAEILSRQQMMSKALKSH